MYAVIETGGKQYRVTEGQEFEIEKLPVETGAEIIFDKVLMISDETDLKLGAPYLAGAKVKAVVLAQGRGDKIRVIKHRRRKNYHREIGHRQYLTKVQITGVSYGS